MVKYSKKVIIFIISLVIAWGVHREITADVLLVFAPVFYGNTITHVVFIVIEAMFIYLIITQISKKKLDKETLRILLFCYFTLLVVCLFFRFTQSRGINLNPLDAVKSIKQDPFFLVSMLVNMVLFLPLGILMRDKAKKIVIPIGILIFVIVEILQYILRVGISDINDVILNFIGYYIGYYIGSKYLCKK